MARILIIIDGMGEKVVRNSMGKKNKKNISSVINVYGTRYVIRTKYIINNMWSMQAGRIPKSPAPRYTFSRREIRSLRAYELVHSEYRPPKILVKVKLENLFSKN